MTSRRARRSRTPGRWRLAAALPLTALALSACAGSGTDGSGVTVTGEAASSYRATELPPEWSTPDATFTDTEGATVRLPALLRGRSSLVFFGYTNCPDICPTTMADLAIALRRVPADVRKSVQVVFITADPARDTGPVMRRWLDRFDPGFVGLTAPLPEVIAVGKALGVPVSGPEGDTSSGSYEVGHGTQVLGFDAAGEPRLVWSGGSTVGDFAHDLPLLVKES